MGQRATLDLYLRTIVNATPTAIGNYTVDNIILYRISGPIPRIYFIKNNILYVHYIFNIG